MNIIEISGGLGNQMFQYAFYLSMLERCKRRIDKQKIEIDVSMFENDGLRKLEVNRFPNVLINPINESIASDFRGYGPSDTVLDKIRHKVQKGRQRIYRENLDLGFQPCVYDLKDTLICGYWQSEKYFKDIADEVRSAFSFPEELTGKDMEDLFVREKTTGWKGIKENILDAGNDSVSLHIRRKDYLIGKNAQIYGGICTEDYYNRAINKINSMIERPHFFVFSDDMDWVAENLDVPNAYYVDGRGKWDDFTDLYLMSICNHHIIANSSFSWCGAWLPTNEDKIVISPSKWFNNHEQADMICEDWLRV